MSKLIVSAISGGDMRQTGIILNNGEPLEEQFKRDFGGDCSFPLAPEDKLIIQKLMQLKELSVPLNEDGGEPQLIVSEDGTTEVGLFSPDKENAGVYDIRLTICVYNYLTDKQSFGINGCRMLYHFPAIEGLGWESIQKLGLEESDNTSPASNRFGREQRWAIASLFKLPSRGQLFSGSMDFNKFLTACVERSWKLFFEGKVKETEYAGNFMWEAPLD